MKLLSFGFYMTGAHSTRGLSRVTICTCELRNMNLLSQYSPECNTSRDVLNPSVTCTLPCTGTPQKDTHLALMLQTLEHVLKDILKASGAGGTVSTSEHRLPVPMSPAAGTLQFQQLQGSFVGAVSLERPSMNVCCFLMPSSRAWLPNFLCLSYHFFGLWCSGTNSGVNVPLQRGCSTL